MLGGEGGTPPPGSALGVSPDLGFVELQRATTSSPAVSNQRHWQVRAAVYSVAGHRWRGPTAGNRLKKAGTRDVLEERKGGGGGGG